MSALSHLCIVHHALGQTVVVLSRWQLVMSVGESFVQLQSACCGSLLSGTEEDFRASRFQCSLCGKSWGLSSPKGGAPLPSLRAAVDAEGEFLLALLTLAGADPLDALVTVAEVREELAAVRAELALC